MPEQEDDSRLRLRVHAAYSWIGGERSTSCAEESRSTTFSRCKRKRRRNSSTGKVIQPLLVAVSGVSPAEGDVAVVKSDQSVVGNGDTMGVGAAPQTSLSSIDKPDRARSREGNPRERAGTANPRFFNPFEFLDHTGSRRTRSASASPLNVDHQRFHKPPFPPGIEALDGETSAPVVLSRCVVSWRRRRRTHLFVAPDQGSRISLDKSGGIR